MKNGNKHAFRLRAYRPYPKVGYTQEFPRARDAIETLEMGRNAGEFCGGDIDVWVEGIGWTVWAGTYA